MYKIILIYGICFLKYNLIYCISEPIPTGFQFGASTASYQIEGGYDSDGKGPNIWDKYTHMNPSPIKDKSTGDVTCNSYNLWQEDLKMIKFLNLHFYRFSISWSRILPTGFSNYVNKKGIAYYDRIINELLEIGVEPMVTLYHWDLPESIQNLGGWTNIITSDYFVDFVGIVFSHFGDRVKTWITINEPSSICIDTYEQGNGAPGVVSPGIGSYLCGKTILLAHAKAYRLYEKQFKNKQHGKVGITIDSIWAEAETTNDKTAAEREMQMSFGWFAHPIFSKTGDYPTIMKTIIDQRSAKQNFSKSRLPSFTQDELKMLLSSADFLGLNHYHTWAALEGNYSTDEISFLADKGTILKKCSNWPNTDILPWGFRKLLNWIKSEYDNPLIYVTENGFGDSNDFFNDHVRVEYLEKYIEAMLKAVNEEGCNVTKYSVWSLMDNMEWTDGYTVKFGLHYVNFSDPHRTRTSRSSALFYKRLITFIRERNVLFV